MRAACLVLLSAAAANTAAGQTTSLQRDILQDYYRNLPDAKISAAIRAAIDEQPSTSALTHAGFSAARTPQASQYAAFSKALDEARIPFCLHADGLKFQPTSIGPIGVVGVYALPMVAVAALRGKCKL